MAVYEFCEHGDLTSYLAKHPKKRYDDAFMSKVFESILSALEHLESCGYMHCDIKPENVRPKNAGRGREKTKSQIAFLFYYRF